MEVYSIAGELGPIEALEFVQRGEFCRGDDVILQQRVEPRNDVADKMRQLMERWEQSISPTNRRLNERFTAGEIHVLIAFRDTKTGEVWFACLERYASDNHVFADGQNETMLIGVVESSEQPESLIPAFVRFERIYGLNRFPPRTLYMSSLSGFITLKGIHYRELNVFPFFGGSFTERHSDHNQVKREMVESGSQVVNHVSGTGGNVGGVDVQRSEVHEWVASLRLRIEANQLKGCFAKRQDSRFEFVEVLLGPFNFYADQADSVVGSH